MRVLSLGASRSSFVSTVVVLLALVVLAAFVADVHRKFTGHGHEAFRRSGGGAKFVQETFQELLLFWVSIWVSNRIFNLTRLASVLWYLILGSVYGNIHILLHGQAMVFFSEFAITMTFFAMGFEESVPNFLAGIAMSWGIALIGAICPYVVGFVWAIALFPELGWKIAMITGLACMATAVSLTMSALKSEGYSKTKACMGIMTSAVLDDVLALICMAVMMPIASTAAADRAALDAAAGEGGGGGGGGHRRGGGGDDAGASTAAYDAHAAPAAEGGINIGDIIIVILKVILFFTILAFAYLVILPRKAGREYLNLGFTKPGFVDIMRLSGANESVLCAIIFGISFALLGSCLGFHYAIGAYMGGLVLCPDDFKCEDPPVVEEGHADAAHGAEGAAHDDHHDDVFHTAAHIFEDQAFNWLGPCFFLHLGSTIVFDADTKGEHIGFGFVLMIFLWVIQFVSAALAARFVPGGYSWCESLLIGIGMLGRAELYLLVLNSAFSEFKILPKSVFIAMMICAVLMNASIPYSILVYKHVLTKMGLPDGTYASEQAALKAAGLAGDVDLAVVKSGAPSTNAAGHTQATHAPHAHHQAAATAYKHEVHASNGASAAHAQEAKHAVPDAMGRLVIPDGLGRIVKEEEVKFEEIKLHVDLPAGWQEAKTAEGAVYYWNTETQETSWIKPSSKVNGLYPPSDHEVMPGAETGSDRTSLLSRH